MAQLYCLFGLKIEFEGDRDMCILINQIGLVRLLNGPHVM